MDLERWYSQLLEEIDADGTHLTAKRTITDIKELSVENQEKFAAWHSEMFRRICDNLLTLASYQGYRSDILPFLRDSLIREIKIEDLTQDDINGYISKRMMEVKPSRYSRQFGTIQQFLEFLGKNDFVYPKMILRTMLSKLKTYPHQKARKNLFYILDGREIQI